MGPIRSSRLLVLARRVALVAVSVGAIRFGLASAAADPSALAQTFDQTVRPFVEAYCIDCHGATKPKAKFSLHGFTALNDVRKSPLSWGHVVEKLREGEMPPEDADVLPDPQTVSEVIAWYDRLRRYEAEQNDGDPGSVLARRLSNAEYNYAIEDLTGMAIEPTKDFPIDAANQAGFDNSGESLSVSPGLLTKYLQAARKVSEHLVLTPDGFSWSAHPAVTETDRDKFAVLRIIDFYQKHATDLSDYFYLAWQHQLDPSRSIERLAADHGLSGSYAQLIRETLESPGEIVGPIHKLKQLMQAIPEVASALEAREHCQGMRDYALTIRREIEPRVENLQGGSVHRGSQTYVIWKNGQYAANRRSYDPKALMTPKELEERIAAVKEANEKNEGNRRRQPALPVPDPHPDLMLPDAPDSHAAYHRAFARFANVFPDRFVVSERGRDYLGKDREEQEKGRLLSAGFHSMMGYYRDDQPLYDLILNDEQRTELDRLWLELDFVTKAPRRQYIGFLWFERTDSRFMTDAEFDFARPEHADATSHKKITQLAQVYLGKATRQGAGDLAKSAIGQYFEDIDDRIRWLDQAESDAEDRHLEALLSSASQAYRRPLDDRESLDLLRFYQYLKDDGDLGHEVAIRDCLVSLLVSPHFFYRVNSIVENEDAPIAPLSDRALASRLSSFLWAGLPDAELAALAESGRLNDEGVLRQQIQRMLRDPRIRRMAIEFGANWLDFRRFGSHNAVDRNLFPQFTNTLRAAMFEEPIRFLTDVMQNDRSIDSLIYGTHTFANRELASHYGFLSPGEESLEPQTWRRIDQAASYGRGGLLPMSVFLTMNAPGRRTSPVKRGYWIARRVLGEAIPPPPPNVPDLPDNEADLGSLTLSEALAVHREHPNCAACHERFDSFGLVFENYGPIGELREEDLGNRTVSTLATFPGGRKGEGLAALKAYLADERVPEFRANLCRKLLAYALGRTLILSDEPLIERTLAKLANNDYRFNVIIESIVLSKQFRTARRNTEESNH